MNDAQLAALIGKWKERVSAYEENIKTIHNSDSSPGLIMQARQNELERCILEIEDAID